MGKKSVVIWLAEPGLREILKKTLEEAKQLLAQGKDYVRHVIRAWIERKASDGKTIHSSPSASASKSMSRENMTGCGQTRQ